MSHWSQVAFVSALGLSLLHSLWQGALLGLVGFALHKRLKHAAPDLRCGTFSLLQLTFFAVWLATFLSLYRVAIHPVVPAVSILTGPIFVGPSAPSTALRETPALMRLLPSLTPFLVTIWALGVCTLSLRHLGGLLLLYRLSRSGTVPCLPAWEACAERLAAQMGIGRKILLRCTAQIDVPCAFGQFRSYVLLPASAMMGLTPEQAEALIAHELAHIARHDTFFNFVQVCMETILFYHPVVWWLSMQIGVAREQRCDDLAVQVIGDRAVYARALYSLEEARATIPQLALGAKGGTTRMTNWHLIHRIQRVLGVSGPEKRDPWAKGALALCAAAIGLATLVPIRAYSRPTQQDGATKQVKTITVTTNILLNINGDQIELNTTDLTPDTLVKVNGKEGRFGDLTPKQQQQLQQAVKAVHVIGGPNDGNTFVSASSGGKSKVLLNVNGAKYEMSHPGGKPKIRLFINGDKVVITADSNDFSTKDMTPDTRVSVNGKEGRFGDLTALQQQQIRATNASIHVVTSSTTEGVIPGEVNKEVTVKVQKQVPPPTPPDKP